MDLSDEFGNDENYCINRDHRDRAKKYNIKVPHIVSVISDTKYQKKIYVVSQWMKVWLSYHQKS